MRQVFIFLRTVFMFCVWAIVCTVFTLLCIPLALLPASIRYDNRLYFALTYAWNALLMWATGLRVEVSGQEHLPAYPNDPSIIIMNHASSLDIFLMETLIGTYPHVWMSKAVYGKIPFFNILLKRMHVLVSRANPREAMRALVKQQNLVAGKARHALMFPEGTRYDDGKIHDFFAGYTRLAQKLNRPVIPIVVSGFEKIFPRGTMWVDTKAAHVKISIGKPMHMHERETVQEYNERVRDWCVTEYQKISRDR